MLFDEASSTRGHRDELYLTNFTTLRRPTSRKS
jgi:hypothetical protein